MTQIIFRATTATTVAAGAVITTGNAQLLPDWAPPIQYVGTTAPWLCIIMNNTTGVSGAAADPTHHNKLAKVRAYGRRSTLHGGRECFATNRMVKGIGTSTIRPFALYVFTYRAVGELVRP